MRPCSRQSVESCASAMRLAQRVGRPAERRGRLREVVLQQPGLGERGADGQLVFAVERAGPEQGAGAGRLPPRGRARGRRSRGRGSDAGLASATPGVYKVYKRDGSYNRGRMPLAAHGVTHTGRRTTNEDALLVDADRGLFVVADGMGGHNAGEVASSLAVKTIGEFLARRHTCQRERARRGAASGQRPHPGRGRRAARLRRDGNDGRALCS